MAVFIVLWPYLLTTKLRCLQKNNIVHTKQLNLSHRKQVQLSAINFTITAETSRKMIWLRSQARVGGIPDDDSLGRKHNIYQLLASTRFKDYFSILLTFCAVSWSLLYTTTYKLRSVHRADGAVVISSMLLHHQQQFALFVKSRQRRVKKPAAARGTI